MHRITLWKDKGKLETDGQTVSQTGVQKPVKRGVVARSFLTKSGKLSVKKLVMIVFSAAVILGGGYGIYRLFFYEEPVEVVTGTTVRDSITTIITGTATTMPTSFQDLTIPVDGTVKEVFVQQGDAVEVGDPLYTIEAESIDNDIAALESTITDYENQLADLNESVGSLTVNAPFTGKLTAVSVEDGSDVSTSTKLCTIVDDSKMRLDVYFSVAYKADITTGMSASVSIPEYMTTLTGTIVGIKNVSYVTAEGAECFKVSIVIDNPGSLKSGLTATATVTAGNQEISPAESGTLQYYKTAALTAGATGEISLISLEESMRVTSGELLAVIDNNDYAGQITTLEKKIESSKLNLENLYESRDACAATAEVAGTVIFVRIEAGDEVQADTNAMAIYNTDAMEIEANINEVQNEYIELGMEVTITKSGASADQSFKGTVTEVSLEATSSNGVAYFPTTITIDSAGSLSAGVYVTYTITAAQASDVVLAPIAALKNTTAGTCLFIQSDTKPDNAVDLEDGVVPDGYYAVPVETGLTSNQYVEIISGVDEGVTVFQQFVSTGSGVAGSDETSESSDDATQTQNFGQMPSGGFPGGPGGMGGQMGG